MELIETIEKKTGWKDAPRYENSPFLERLHVRTHGKMLTVARGTALLDTDTGELQGTTVIAQIKYVDNEEFVKIFTKNLAVWFDLKKSALRVFGALLQEIQRSAIGKDIVFFDHGNKALKDFKISKPAFYRGLDELIDKGFIARHKSSGLVFINPAMFFNGDRAVFINEYRKNKRNELLDTRQKNLFSEPAISEEPEGSENNE